MKKMQSHLYKELKVRNILFYIALFNILFATITSKKISTENLENQKQNKRNLQYAMNSIYYNLMYPANDITGTGDKLKDVPYKVLCKILACNSGCCVGEVDNMRCGVADDCKVYSNYAGIPGMVIAIVVPIAVFLILVFLFVFFMKYKKYSCVKSFCLCLGCLFIVTIPIVIYFYFCKKEASVTPNKKEK